MQFPKNIFFVASFFNEINPLRDLFHFTLRPTGAIFHNFREEIISHSAGAEYFTCNPPDFMLYYSYKTVKILSNLDGLNKNLQAEAMNSNNT